MATARAAILSMNPVWESQNSEIKINRNKLTDLPKFIKKGTEVEVMVTNPEDYIPVGDLGIMYTNISDGEGEGISKKHKVYLSCKYYKESRFVEIIPFKGSLTEFAKEYGQGVEKAIEGMKLNGLRRIIIPPKVSGLKEYIFLDVTLGNIKKARWGNWSKM